MQRARTAVILVAVTALGFGLAAAVALAGVTAQRSGLGVNVKVIGRFAVTGRITRASGIPGEHTGERLRRIWTIVPRSCAESDCARLELTRPRAAGHVARITLHRVGFGLYRGTGRFDAAVRCLGHVAPRGSVVPYLITLRVTAFEPAGGLRLATAFRATYFNDRRFDRTRCPLGEVRDAARYTGTIIAPPPPPPPPTTTTATTPTPVPPPPPTTTATSTSTSTTATTPAPLPLRSADSR